MIELESILKEGACLVGVGNSFRRDDGVGPWLARSLEQSGFEVMDAGDVLENHVFDIARGGTRNVILMDAVSTDLEPGSIVFGPLDAGGEPEGLSTHKLALGLCGRILETEGKRTFLLGIVPRDLEFGTGLSEDVARAASEVRDIILRARTATHEENLHER